MTSQNTCIWTGALYSCRISLKLSIRIDALRPASEARYTWPIAVAASSRLRREVCSGVTSRLFPPHWRHQKEMTQRSGIVLGVAARLFFVASLMTFVAPGKWTFPIVNSTAFGLFPFRSGNYIFPNQPAYFGDSTGLARVPFVKVFQSHIKTFRDCWCAISLHARRMPCLPLNQ